MSVKGKFKLYNVATTEWVTYWLATVTSQVASDSTSRRYVTDDQLALINSFTNSGLSSGVIWVYDQVTSKWVASSDYLTKASPEFTGTMLGTVIKATGASGNTHLKLHAQSTDLTTESYLQLNRDGNLVLMGTGAISLYGTSINIQNQKILNVGTPTQSGDATNKEYVDNLVATGTKPVNMVKCATIQNMASLNGTGTAIDNIAVVAGDRVLVWKQTTPSQNGIYTVASGAWTKVTADSGKGALVFVDQGSTYNDYEFFNTDGTTWIEYAKHDTYSAGAGITKTGNQFSIGSLAITNAMLAGSIALSKLGDVDAPVDTLLIGDTTNSGVADSIVDYFSSIMSAIKVLRGSANYNTSNAQTIAGAYLKNKVYLKTTVNNPTGTAEMPLRDNDICIDTYVA